MQWSEPERQQYRQQVDAMRDQLDWMGCVPLILVGVRELLGQPRSWGFASPGQLRPMHVAAILRELADRIEAHPTPDPGGVRVLGSDQSS